MCHTWECGACVALREWCTRAWGRRGVSPQIFPPNKNYQRWYDSWCLVSLPLGGANECVCTAAVHRTALVAGAAAIPGVSVAVSARMFGKRFLYTEGVVPEQVTIIHVVKPRQQLLVDPMRGRWGVGVRSV